MWTLYIRTQNNRIQQLPIFNFVICIILISMVPEGLQKIHDIIREAFAMPWRLQINYQYKDRFFFCLMSFASEIHLKRQKNKHWHFFFAVKVKFPHTGNIEYLNVCPNTM